MQAGGRTSGFTIVELLIVIVVVAILAAISILAYRGVTSNAHASRAASELSAMSRAVMLYHADRGEYPEDVDRGLPVAIFDYSGSGADPNWPNAPWPGSVYDYDHFIHENGEEVVQISIRFCPLGGPMSACNFPNEPWAENFDLQSSVYWCIKGTCRAHPSAADDHPGYCLNCRS